MSYKFEADYVPPRQSIGPERHSDPMFPLPHDRGESAIGGEISVKADGPFADRSENSPDIRGGIIVPFSNMVEGLFRPDFPTRASQMYPVMRAILDSVMEEEGIRVLVRGSTLTYAAGKAEGSEGWGTLTSAAQIMLRPVVDRFGHLKSVQALQALINNSDLDLILEGVDDVTFEEVNARIKTRIDSALVEGVNQNGQESRTRKKVETPVEKSRIYIKHQDGAVANGTIPYGEVAARTESGQKLFTVFWSAESRSNNDEPDLRRGSDYSLSWDSNATGYLIIGADAVDERAYAASELRQKATRPREKRMIAVDGVFSPADFVDAKDDIWLHIPKEDLNILGSQIEVGSRFDELPVIDRFLLAVRAAQKGAIAETNLRLTENGIINSVKEMGDGAAISLAAKEVFSRISPDEFSNAYNMLPDEEKAVLQKEVMMSMMMGFFYPARFIEYGLATDIFRFFPQLRDIDMVTWEGVMSSLPPHEQYLKRQYIATHFWEVESDSIFSNELGDDVLRARNFNAFEDPYKLFVDALIKVAPDIVPMGSNAYEILETLFSMDKVDFELGGAHELEDLSARQGSKYFGEDPIVKAQIRYQREGKLREARSRRSITSTAASFTPVGLYTLATAANQFVEVPGLGFLDYITKFPTGLLTAIPVGAWSLFMTFRKDKVIEEIRKSERASDWELDREDIPRG